MFLTKFILLVLLGLNTNASFACKPSPDQLEIDLSSFTGILEVLPHRPDSSFLIQIPSSRYEISYAKNKGGRLCWGEHVSVTEFECFSVIENEDLRDPRAVSPENIRNRIYNKDGVYIGWVRVLGEEVRVYPATENENVYLRIEQVIGNKDMPSLRIDKIVADELIGTYTTSYHKNMIPKSATQVEEKSGAKPLSLEGNQIKGTNLGCGSPEIRELKRPSQRTNTNRGSSGRGNLQ